MSKYKPFKTIAVASLIAISSINLFACTGKSEPAPKIQVEQNATSGNGDIIKDNEQKPSVGNATDFYEYKQVTVNENGVKIYGKKLDEKDPMYEKIYDPLGDKNQAKRGYSYTYTRYDSPAYGGTVFIKTCNEDGGREIYNENGQRFMSGDAESKNYDLENSLAKYRLGNAMAEAIDRKIKKK